MRVLRRLAQVALGFGLLAAAACQSSATPLKRIALTFDDAPRGDTVVFDADTRAKRLIAELEAAGAGPVAFFVTTRGLTDAAAKARIAAYADAGHLIANHTHTHPWAMRTAVSDYLADIDEAAARLDALDISPGQRRAWFRFPFLDEGVPLEKRNALRAELRDRGLFNGYVTIDNYDWHIDAEWRRAVRAGRTIDLDALSRAYVDIILGAVRFYDDLAVAELGASPPHVLLLHENDAAALFIGDLVEALRAEGWEIISPDDAYADPIARRVPETLMTRQGHVAALAVEAGVPQERLTHLAIDEAAITAALEEYGVFEPN